MLGNLGRNWWILVLRGVLAVIFGVIAIASPGITLATLILFFGWYAIIAGIFAVIGAISGARRFPNWWALLLEGLLAVLVGIIALSSPGTTAVSFALLVAAWAVVSGVMQIVAAIRLRQEIQGEWLLALGGVLSILLGVLFFASPGAALVTLVWLLGAYTIVFGISAIALGFRVRGRYQSAGGAAAA